MVETVAQVRHWGRSLGVVIPKEVAEKEHLKAGQEIRLIILKTGNPAKESFGTFKFSKPIAQIMKEIDKEAWDD